MTRRHWWGSMWVAGKGRVWYKITAECELNSGACWKQKLFNLDTLGYEGPQGGEVAVV